ncbi:hypothetical protein ACU635_18965 [[Actinomadura] parvosata]|uniref:hypothetical protein n=1 Tax=[Actinomadura] parvosata TaxID=1955412 RepID=UPI00406CA87A
MEQTGGRGRRRHAAGRHVAGGGSRRGRRRKASAWTAALRKRTPAPDDADPARASGPAESGLLGDGSLERGSLGDGSLERGPLVIGSGPGAARARRLPARRSRWTGRRGRLAVVGLALAGGAVVLAGMNGGGGPFALLGAFGGAQAGSGAAAGPGRGDGSPGSEGASGIGAGYHATTGVNGGTGVTGVNDGTGPGGTAVSDGGTPGGGPEASAEARMREAQRSGAPDAATTPGRPQPGMVAGTTAPEDVLAGGPDPGDGDDYRADGPSRHTDQQAAAYFRTNWGLDDKALKHLKDIRSVGGYLRIYTDLPETADNSLTAIILCERGYAYLRSRGVEEPVVFVQAEFGENGNPVLANILGPADKSCRVTSPAAD